MIDATAPSTQPAGPGHAIDQLVVLTRSDLRSRYGRGRWQLVKWLIDPFALVGVYLLMVTFIFYRRPAEVGLSLTCAIIPFQLVMMTVQSSLRAVQTRQAILANMRIRRELLPIATTLTEMFGFAASLVLLVAMMLVYQVPPTIELLWLPVALTATVLVGIAVAFPVSLIGVWAPDLSGIILSIARASYYLAPGLVTLAAIHGRTNTIVRLNPLTGLFESVRHAVMYRSTPSAWELIVPVGFAVVMLAIFVPIYRREAEHFAKVID